MRGANRADNLGIYETAQKSAGHALAGIIEKREKTIASVFVMKSSEERTKQACPE